MRIPLRRHAGGGDTVDVPFAANVAYGRLAGIADAWGAIEGAASVIVLMAAGQSR